MQYIRYGKERLKDPLFLIVLIVFELFSLASIIYFAVIGQYRNVGLGAICFFSATPVFIGFEYLLKLRIVPIFEFLVLFVVTGSVLFGPAYDWYAFFPFWDDIMHVAGGGVFLCMGFSITRKVVLQTEKKSFFINLLGGFCFCLSVLFIWELLEYFGSTFFPVDMQDDVIIHDFKSFILSGTNNFVMFVNDITKTVIYYGEGQTLELDGYLELGMYDTLNDMFMGFLGAVLFGISLIVDHFLKKRLIDLIVPTNAIKE